jgi:hypothetical protein
MLDGWHAKSNEKKRRLGQDMQWESRYKEAKRQAASLDLISLATRAGTEIIRE